MLKSFREHKEIQHAQGLRYVLEHILALKPHRAMGTSESRLAANISEVVDCREYLRPIAAVTAFLGKQGIAFCGHREAPGSHNKENFKE